MPPPDAPTPTAPAAPAAAPALPDEGDALPAEFVRTVCETNGADGRWWLDALPALVAACERRFRVRVTGTAPQLSYNLVLWADAADRRGDEAAVVLKLSVRGDESLAEAGALAAFGGAGAVRLLDHWPDGRALLIERARPGGALGELEPDDRRAMEVFASLAPELWVAAPAGFAGPSVAQWTRGFARLRDRFGGGTGPLPAPLVARAEGHFRELLDSAPPPRLLHGDLHYGNVLAAARRPWLAIDPKGAIGEPAVDVGYLVCNPSPHLLAARRPPARVLADRLAFLPAALGLDRARIAAYAFAQSMLSACWTLEDHGTGWERAVWVAEMVQGLRH